MTHILNTTVTRLLLLAAVPFAVYVQHREAERVLGRFPTHDDPEEFANGRSLAVMHALDKLNLLIDVKAGQRVAVTKHRQRRLLRKLKLLAKNSPPPEGEQPMFRMEDRPAQIAMPSAADLQPNPVALAAKMRMAGVA